MEIVDFYFLNSILLHYNVDNLFLKFNCNVYLNRLCCLELHAQIVILTSKKSCKCWCNFF